MLSDWDAPYIQPLVKLIEKQSKTTITLVLWKKDVSFYGTPLKYDELIRLLGVNTAS